MYRQIMDWFGAAGLEPMRLDICTSVTVIAHLVETGMAVGFLPRKLIAPALDRGTIVQLGAIPAIMPPRVYAAQRITEDSPAINVIIRTVRQVLSQKNYLMSE